jgi:hypothetical protein
MPRSNPNHWDEGNSSRDWSSGRGRGGGEGGRGYSSDQVYGQGSPAGQRGRNDFRESERRGWESHAFEPRRDDWADDRWNENRWKDEDDYRSNQLTSQPSEGDRFGRVEFGHGFDSRHPRFGESRLATQHGREQFPDYQGMSYEGRESSQLRLGARSDHDQRYAGRPFGNPSSYGAQGYGGYGGPTRQGYGTPYGASSPNYGPSSYGASSYGAPNYGSPLRFRASSAHVGKGPKGYSRSDDRIRDDVCERLTYDPDIDASDITVTVSQGEVTLAGEVEDRSSKRRAEDVLEDVPGVRDVHNQLRSRRGFFGSMVDEVTGKHAEENNVGKGPSPSTSASSSSGSTPSVKNGGAAYR